MTLYPSPIERRGDTKVAIGMRGDFLTFQITPEVIKIWVNKVEAVTFHDSSQNNKRGALSRFLTSISRFSSSYVRQAAWILWTKTNEEAFCSLKEQLT